MTKDTMKDAAVAGDSLLFDDWFDTIEDGVRARVRGFIETMLEEELSGTLSRPRTPASKNLHRSGRCRCTARVMTSGLLASDEQQLEVVGPAKR